MSIQVPILYPMGTYACDCKNILLIKNFIQCLLIVFILTPSSLGAEDLKQHLNFQSPFPSLSNGAHPTCSAHVPSNAEDIYVALSNEM